MTGFATNAAVHDKFLETAISRPLAPKARPHGMRSSLTSVCFID